MKGRGVVLVVAALALTAALAGCGKDSDYLTKTTPDGWRLIRTAAELDAVRYDLSGKYMLLNDISLAEYSDNWQPIGSGFVDDAGTFVETPFTGKFDGSNHKITDLPIKPGYYAGLFGCVDGGSVNNLGVEVAADAFNGGIYTGCIAGRSVGGTIVNCYSTGINSYCNYTGGIVGSVESGTITGCHSAGSFMGMFAGGIAGAASGSAAITDCYTTGTVVGVDTGGSTSGGIVGVATDSTVISNCYSSGNVGSASVSGGIAGSVDGITIANCYSAGNIESWASGGIVGDIIDGTITDCYSTGNIAGWNCGGIAGEVFGGAITGCAAINPTISSMYGKAGRISGYIDSDYNVDTPIIISNNFALDVMSATGAVQFDPSDPRLHGVSKTDVQLTTKSTYSSALVGDGTKGGLGWKFGNSDASPWKMPTDGGYPILYWQ